MVARHKVTSSIVAIKVIQKQSAYDESEPQPMEVTLESKLRPLKLNGHIEMQEFLIDDKFIYIVRPFQNRGNILKVMKDHRINLLNESEIRSFVKPIIRTLMAIHQAGFLHGDIRPKNIFIQKSSSNEGAVRCAIGDYERCCKVEA